jgi:hypothetical protein
MRIIIKGTLFTAIITLCTAVHALPADGSPQSAGAVSVEIQPRIPTAEDPCGLGPPPIGGCSILVTAYCEALASCWTTAASVPKTVGGTPAQQGGGSTKSGRPSVLPLQVVENSIKVECTRKYGCANP